MEHIDIFYQGTGNIEFDLIEAQADHTVAMIKAVITEKHGLNGELLIFIEDQEHPLDEQAVIGDFCKGQSTKLHVHHCRHVETAVTFVGETVHHKFAPAVTVGAIKKWASIEKIGMTEAEAGEHLLQIAGTKDRPAPGTHVGSLTRCPDCHVHFDLVPDERINGAFVAGA